MSFQRQLVQSLDVLEREAPDHAGRCRAAFGDRTVAIHVDDEQVTVRAEGTRWSIGVDAVEDPAVEARTTSATIVELLDGRFALEEAILDGSVALRGAVTDLLAFHQALTTYVNGAVRAPSFPGLFRAFRRSVEDEST
ncbi:MAG: hypothetical protein AAF799_08160 [Myxococcota bacterium]